jgi:DNA-binding transcriptional LysR family regulator
MKSWDLNIFHIADFLKLVECGNFSAAAEELYITQSALSKHIQSLEKTLGVQLFIRNKKKTELSDGGQLFLPYAQKFNSLFLQMNKDIGQVIGREQTSFNLGCLITLRFYGIIETVADFKAKHPEINVKIAEFRYNTNKTVRNSLTSAEFDLIFCDSIYVHSKRFETRDFIKDHLVAILYHTHPLAAQKYIELKQLSTERLVFLSNLTTTYYYCFDLCEKAGFTPNVYFYGSRIGNVLECVSHNMGIALLMEKFVSRLTSGEIVVRDIVPTAERTVCLARLKGGFHNAASNLFWDYIASNSPGKSPAILTLNHANTRG